MNSSTAGSVRRRKTAEQRQQLLARYHQSQLTQRDFAVRHGLGLSTLSKWLRRESRQSLPPVQFQEVTMPNPILGWAVEVVSPQGWIVRFHNSSEVQTLPLLLRALPC